MTKVTRVLATGAIAAAAVAAVTHEGVARPAPRWVLHAERYPGGISQGVRAYALARGVIAPRSPVPPAIAVVPDASRGAAAGPLVNVQMNIDAHPPLPQNETAVAYDSTNPTVAVAASNDYVEGGLWIGHTSNGGQTWSSWFQAPQVRDSRDTCNGSDPSVVYSARDAAFYVSTLCFFIDRGISEIDVWKSVDGGAHWTPSRLAARVVSNVDENGKSNDSLFFDKELLAVDNNQASPHYGRLYVTYIKFHMRRNGFSDYCPLQVAFTDQVPTRDPSNARWRHVGVLPNTPGAGGMGPSADQWATPVVDTTGGLDVAYVGEDCNSGLDRGLFFKRSTDGGRTFGKRVKINKPGEWADDPDNGDHLPDKNAPIGVSPSLAFDPANETLDYVFGNDAHREDSGADISLAQSTDFGAHWSHAVTLSVDQQGAPAPNDQFFPWIAADGSGGLSVIWFDNRSDPKNRLIETWQADSSDGGATWTSQSISTVAWDPNRSFFSCGCFIGDYNAVAASPTIVYPVWTDGRNTPGSPLGQTDIYTNIEIASP
jgi:hypothetical protein